MYMRVLSLEWFTPLPSFDCVWTFLWIYGGELDVSTETCDHCSFHGPIHHRSHGGAVVHYTHADRPISTQVCIVPIVDPYYHVSSAPVGLFVLILAPRSLLVVWHPWRQSCQMKNILLMDSSDLDDDPAAQAAFSSIKAGYDRAPAPQVLPIRKLAPKVESLLFFVHIMADLTMPS
ncbi:hypothetical protein B0H17DRAFT_1146169 [Mycena rosella]|uniref:Uncharacterized protein n=1 Tax=Mycena rosella TaxID=1033263 RepID=A0AAD7CPG0_MYCRO|nr:hypothetical protein B0H17DRAFT_1146169 [Mycena rosella]